MPIAQAKKDELVNGAESLLSELDKEQKVEEVDVKPKTKVIIIIIILILIILIILLIIIFSILIIRSDCGSRCWLGQARVLHCLPCHPN